MTRPTYFETPKDFRSWLAKNHRSAPELLVGFRKIGSGSRSITWPEAVDQALCFGWIDGIRRRIDEDCYSIRFSPRKPDGTWSAVNIARVAELEAQGLMKAAGLEAFTRRTEKKSRIYSYERKDEPRLDDPHEKMLKADRNAWRFFQAQAPSYRRKVIHWVASAKQEDTRLKRVRHLIGRFAEGKKA